MSLTLFPQSPSMDIHTGIRAAAIQFLPLPRLHRFASDVSRAKIASDVAVVLNIYR